MTTAEKVAFAAGKSEAARRELEELIRKARSEGLPLRTIAASARMSYETVRRICAP